MVKKIYRKLVVWFSVLRQHGFLQFIIMGLQFVQKQTSQTRLNSDDTSGYGDIQTRARYKDIIATDLTIDRRTWTGSSKKSLRLAWLMPPPGKGSGGHLNIFRFIEFLETAGHECTIYLYTEGSHGTISAVRAIMGESYPAINALESMQWLEPNLELSEFDGIFSTSWETAYASYRLKTPVKRFYFVQDFEPYFYPVGGMYSLAENTYKMGFYGITAGGWLKKKLTAEYGMEADSFDFGSDADTYKFTNSGARKEIFYYARPYTERRGFEVGIIALDIFHRNHPEYTINLVGWDVSGYNIPFPYVNLKTLEIHQLSEFYNRCAAGLVLSYTNMSLLPLELLGSGCIPVVNDGENNRLVSNNRYISYSNNDPHSLAQKLSEVVSRKDRVQYAREASESVRDSAWGASGTKFVRIIEKEMKK